MLRVAGEQRASAHASWRGEDQRPAHASEYGFLLGSCIDEATLARAIAIADRTGVYPHDVLIAHGWVKAEAYYRALAKELGVPFEPRPNGASVEAPSSTASPRDCLAKGLIRERSRTQRLLFAPDRLRPVTLREVLARLRPRDVALAPPHAVRRAIYHHFRDSFAHDAIEALAERHPDGPWRSVPPDSSAHGYDYDNNGGHACACRRLLAVIGLRIVAAADLLRRSAAAGRETCARLSDAELPVYTLLVPLLREANVLPALVRTLSRLDYPAAKLDIKLILEAADGDTIAAARALDLPGNCEVVIVPDLAPRTKPKAMNYALPLARGRISCHLRRGGPPRARPTPPRGECLPPRRAQSRGRAGKD